MIWVIFIGFIIGTVILRNLALDLLTTKAEKNKLKAISLLKQEQKEQPQNKVEIGAKIYSIRFSSWKYALKMIIIKYGLIILFSTLCIKLFSPHIKLAILYYLAGLIGLNILYRRIFK